MRRFLIAALVAGFATLPAFADEPAPEAPAEEQARPAVQYVVLEADARVPFGGSQVNSFRAGEDGSLILRVGVNRWYRATLFAPCERDLPWEQEIVLVDRGIGLDKFSAVIVDGQRCNFRTFDRIEDPRIAERAAEEAQNRPAS